MEQHRLLTWDPECREVLDFDMPDIDRLDWAKKPWCWLVREEGNSWDIHKDGYGGGELYYASLME